MKLRYVILHHTGFGQPHFDLMFETAPDSDLLTFRSPYWPIESPTKVTRLPDHRRAYLTYEGPVSGHRGEVRRVEAGACEVQVSPNAVRLLLDARVLLQVTKDADEAWTIRPGA